MPRSTEGAARPEVRFVQLTPGLTAFVLVALLLWVARGITGVLLLLFLAALLAVFLDSLKGWLVRRFSISARAAFAVAVLITLLSVVGIGALLVPPVIDQTRALVAQVPAYVTGWQARLATLVQRFPALEPLIGPERQGEFVDAAVAEAERFLGALLPRAFSFLHGIIDLFAVLVMALYLSLQPKTYADFVVAVTPPRFRAASREVTAAVIQSLRAWTLAQLLAMSVLAVLTAIGLWILQVPYWLPFGIFTGLAAIVPFFGSMISTVLPAIFVLGAEDGFFRAFLVLLLGVVVHIFEANLVAPIIMQRGVNLPPVFTIMAVLVAGALLGPVGLLVAVPLLAVVMVLVRKVLVERVYGDSPDAAPAAVPARADTTGDGPA